MRRVISLPSAWRREALRTNLWLVPCAEIALAVVLFVGTHALDRAAYDGSVHFPSFFISGSADAARQILTAIAAAVITVVTLVFSITIVTLTLASTQFGPRMLRNFIRDRITQFTLGTFVATFVYAILALVSIGPGSRGYFVPHLSITVTMALVLLDVTVLVLFINHIAKSIQLPQVIASIAGDLSHAIDIEVGGAHDEQAQVRSFAGGDQQASRRRQRRRARPEQRLPAVRADRRARRRRPAEWRGDPPTSPSRPLRRRRAAVGERVAGNGCAHGRTRAGRGARHGSAPHARAGRVLCRGSARRDCNQGAVARGQDPVTARACIDWLGEGLCKIANRWQPNTVHRDATGHVRVITVAITFRRLVERAHEKIRQASRAMPAVMIRQLDALGKVMEYASSSHQREVLLAEAEKILRVSEESVQEHADRADVRAKYDHVVRAAELDVFDGA